MWSPIGTNAYGPSWTDFGPLSQHDLPTTLHTLRDERRILERTTPTQQRNLFLQILRSSMRKEIAADIDFETWAKERRVDDSGATALASGSNVPG